MEVAEAEGDDHRHVVPVPSQSESVVVVVAELPNEIIWFQILPRLPAKSLMRFKCVCKSWFSLITRNPSFRSAYQNFHCRPNLTHVLLKVEDKATGQQHILSLQINQDGIPSSASATHLLTHHLSEEFHPLHYTHCTNSLFCFVFGDGGPICVFNPCTRESISLPSTSHANDHSTSPANVFCPVNTGYFLGFNPLNNEYMVLQVQLCRSLLEEPVNFYRMAASVVLHVFTLGSDSWRCVEVNRNDLPFDPTVWQIDTKSVCLHGAIHWIHEEEKCILVFDLAEERFRVIPLPPEDDGSRYRYPRLSDVGGCLALTYDKKSMQSYSGFTLWILKDYQNQVWVKETINPSYPALHTTYPFSYVCAVQTGEALILSSSPAQASIHFYNMKSRSFQTCSILLPEWICRNVASTRRDVISTYDETIVPLT